MPKHKREWVAIILLDKGFLVEHVFGTSDYDMESIRVSAETLPEAIMTSATILETLCKAAPAPPAEAAD